MLHRSDCRYQKSKYSQRFSNQIICVAPVRINETAIVVQSEFKTIAFEIIDHILFSGR